jgi:hypothetical protein
MASSSATGIDAVGIVAEQREVAGVAAAADTRRDDIDQADLTLGGEAVEGGRAGVLERSLAVEVRDGTVAEAVADEKKALVGGGGEHRSGMRNEKVFRCSARRDANRLEGTRKGRESADGTPSREKGKTESGFVLALFRSAGGQGTGYRRSALDLHPAPPALPQVVFAFFASAILGRVGASGRWRRDGHSPPRPHPVYSGVPRISLPGVTRWER